MTSLLNVLDQSLISFENWMDRDCRGKGQINAKEVKESKDQMFPTIYGLEIYYLPDAIILKFRVIF